MSRYENEYGDVTIPRSEWAALKKAVRDAFNLQQTRRHEFALRFHAKLVESARGVRNADWQTLSRELSYGWPGGLSEQDHDVTWKLFEAATRRLSKEAGRHVDGASVRGTAGRPPKPTKSMYPDATNRTLVFEAGDGRIAFDEDRAVVRWSVGENNHAVDHARKSPIGTAFFAALDKVKWTARTGGTLYGNDEYHRDSHGGEGSGGDYVTVRFGSDRAEHEKRFPPPRPSSFGSGYESSFGRSYGGRLW